MILSQYLRRAAFSKHNLLYSTFQCLELSSHRIAIGGIICLETLKRRALCFPQPRVQTIFTGNCLLQVQEQNKRDSLQSKTADDPQKSTAEKVKQAGRDITYLIVALIGVGVTGGLFYVVFKELFSSSSPSKIYGNAFERCRNHPEVIGAFGEPIKAYGETTRRGRRQHVSSTEYFKGGAKCMRLKFYISGSEPRMQGTVHVDVKENHQTKKYEFQYILVDIDTYPRRTIVVEDNRHSS